MNNNELENHVHAKKHVHGSNTFPFLCVKGKKKIKSDRNL